MASENGGESLVAILEQLSETVSAARAMPMSASALINRAEVLELIEAARAVVPNQITQADRLITRSEDVVARARDEADQIVARAQEQAEQLLAEQAIVTLAQERANAIINDAEHEATRLMQDADLYCDGRLAEFEIDLNTLTTQVAAGRSRLEERIRAREQEGNS